MAEETNEDNSKEAPDKDLNSEKKPSSKEENEDEPEKNSEEMEEEPPADGQEDGSREQETDEEPSGEVKEEKPEDAEGSSEDDITEPEGVVPYNTEELKSETPPPPPPPPPPEEPSELGEVEGYDSEELKKDIEATEIAEEGAKSPELILSEIRKERERLEEEKANFKKERELGKLKEKEDEEEEEIEDERPPQKSKEIKSFTKERRKRKQIERIMDYLFYGEYALLVILIMALLYADGISTNPLKLPLENTIYLIIVFLLVIKVEKLYFRYLNMKYSGTLQRKVIGVDHFTAIEIPSIMLFIFIVAAFIIPPTLGIIKILFKMLSFDGDIIPLSGNFTFILTLLFITHLGIGVGWVLYLKWYKNNVLAPEIAKISEPFVVEDVFLITNSGLLLRHIGKEVKPDMDNDILSSMLTAVNEFVKDSFQTSKEDGDLDELQYGSLRVILAYGKHVYIAAVVRGQESMELRPEMKYALKQINRKFGRILDGWDGNLADIKGIESPLNSLVKLG
jgi:hypothetical protein